MEFKRSDVLNALKKVNIDNGPDNTKFKKQDVIANLGKTIPKPTEKTPDKINQMAVIKKMNGDLSNPAKGIKFESTWRPQPTTVKAITQRILTEATVTPNASPNAFRLDLKSIVLDKCHSKFNIKRKNADAVVELIYPNANGKITVKIHVDGIDDSVYEVGLEDQQYTTNFGASIIKSIDQLLSKQKEQSPSFSTPSQFSNPAVSVSGFSPNWVQSGYTMESDARHMMDLITLIENDESNTDEPVQPPKDLTDVPSLIHSENRPSGLDDIKNIANVMAMVEQGEPPKDEEPTDEAPDAAAATDGTEGADSAVPEGEAGDVNADAFGAEDFSLGGGGGSAPSMGGGDISGGAPDAAPDAVNTDAGGVGLEDNDEYASFKDFAVDNFSTTKNGVVDVLANIVGDALGKQMNNSTQGVKLTSYQISNGMQGLNTRPAIEIIDAFLKLYPALDGEFKVSDLETLAEKLEERPSPTEFNQFLEGHLKEMQNESSTDTDVLQLPDSEMKPMGGAAPTDQYQPSEFGDFMDNASQMGGNEGVPAPEEVTPEANAEDEDVQNTLKKAAEMETGVGPAKNEFPNV